MVELVLRDGQSSTLWFIVMITLLFFFFRFVEESSIIRDVKYIYGLLVEVIKEVGKENVVQVITDNNNNFKKAGKKLMK